MGNEVYKQSKNLGSKKNNAKVDTGPKEIELNRAKNRITKEDFFGGQKKKVVNIMDDEDFPEMDEGADPFAAFS